MTRQRLFVPVALSALLLLVGDITAMGNKPPKKDSQVCLVRPEVAPDADAKGSLRIRSDAKGERVQIKVERVDVALGHDLFLEDPVDSGLFVFVASLEADGDDLRLDLDTSHGDALPLGATATDELIGRRVEVRVASDVVLMATVPAFGLSKSPAKAKAEITAPDGAPAPKMKAALRLRSKADKGQERFDLKVKKVPWADGPFHVFIEDAAGSGVLVDAGALQQKGGSEGRLRRDTKQGDPLSLGVSGVAELAGRALQVRSAADVVYLAGVVPALE